MTEESTTKPGGLPLGAFKGLRGAPQGEESAFNSEAPRNTKAADEEKDEYFTNYFEDDEEESALDTIRATPATFTHQNKYNEIEEMIQVNLRELRQKYPTGGLKAFQFITTEVLLAAPADFFLRYEENVREVTTWVQGTLSEKGASDLIGQAQANQFDEDIQDRAFRSVQSIATEYMEKLPYKGVERSIVIYMAAMDIVGMSRLDPLWRDRRIDELLCNGPHDIQIEMSGQILQVPSCQFRDAPHLENMLERIFSTIGKSLSRTTPYLDGRLYDQSRIAATHRRISPDGPNVAIRRHPEKYWTPMELIKYDSASQELLEEVGNLIYKGCSYIVIGGTGSGKTSLLNAMSGFFNPTQRVLTLEDTLELRMHPNKLIAAAMECVPANPNNLADRGITMRDLVKASLRMRPDGIVVGEVRDGAMYDLCQALNTGHWGASTVHANSPFDGIYRMQSLVTQAELVSGDAALALIAAGFDFILMQDRFPEDGSRKITSVCEIDPYPTQGETGRLELGIRPLWEFRGEGVNSEGKVKGTWEKVGELSELRRKRRHLDLMPDLTWDQLVELCTIPESALNKKKH